MVFIGLVRCEQQIGEVFNHILMEVERCVFQSIKNKTKYIEKTKLHQYIHGVTSCYIGKSMFLQSTRCGLGIGNTTGTLNKSYTSTRTSRLSYSMIAKRATRPPG